LVQRGLIGNHDEIHSEAAGQSGKIAHGSTDRHAIDVPVVLARVLVEEGDWAVPRVTEMAEQADNELPDVAGADDDDSPLVAVREPREPLPEPEKRRASAYQKTARNQPVQQKHGSRRAPEIQDERNDDPSSERADRERPDRRDDVADAEVAP
jgi:hypothetical protein